MSSRFCFVSFFVFFFCFFFYDSERRFYDVQSDFFLSLSLRRRRQVIPDAVDYREDVKPIKKIRENR